MRFLITMVACLVAATSAFGQAEPSVSVAPKQRLSVEVARAAIAAAATNPLTPEAVELALTLANEAARLDPDSVQTWHMLLDLAVMADRDDVKATAIDRLVQIDPSNEGVRLARLNLALNRYQTAPEREAAYQALLSDDNVPRVGEATASRLALDLALLKQREGDVEGFSRWLTRALQLDRANRTAAAIAAGFYRASVNDAAGEAELLVNLVLADPTDIGTQLSLAQLLLDHGAYRGAYRMYKLATDGMKANKNMPSNQVLADTAVAQWAAGDSEAALVTLHQRELELDEILRQQRAQAEQELTRADLAKIKAPADPRLAAVTAIIKTGRGDADAQAALDAAIAAYLAEIDQRKTATPPASPEDLATQHLEIAWIALWLGKDGVKPMELVAAADALVPLSDSAKQRFAGWKSLKDGEVDRAIETLSPLIADDPAARVGLALALEQAGREQDAARELLALNRSQPGSMIGIWASGELARLLGKRLPLSEEASAMERLVASIPQAIDRNVTEASMAVAVRINPIDLNPGPYAPILLRIDLTNNTSLPMALDSAGPLRPQIFVVPTFNTATPLGQSPAPFVVDLDSKLRINPHDTVSVNVDMRAFPIGATLNAAAVTGGLIKLVAYSNFVASNDGSIAPGLYGVEAQAPIIRLDGVRKDDQWLEHAIAMMNDPNDASPDLAVRMALIVNEMQHALVQPGMSAERRTLLASAGELLPTAFARLDADAQAWFLCQSPKEMTSEAILSMARKSDSRYVQLAYLLFHVADVNDPMLDAARRGEDPALKQVANSVTRAIPGTAQASQPAANAAPAIAPSSVQGLPATTAPATVPATVPAPR